MSRQEIDPNICFKIVGTKAFIQISVEFYLVRGQPQFVFTIHDVSNLKKSLKEKKAKKQNMLQLASIVHDLKTPLNCIQGSSWIFKILIENQVPDLLPYMKQFDLSFEFIFSMIEDIQDMAKFNNNQNFSLVNEFFKIRDFLSDVIMLFEEQCKYK